MTFKEAAKAGGIHEDTLDSWRKRGAEENDTIYTRFLGQLGRAAETKAIDYLEAIRQSIMESPVKVREHIKKDESGQGDPDGNPPRDVAPGHQGRDVVA